MKQYLRLRAEMVVNDITGEYLEEQINRSHKYFSDRMNGKGSWTLDKAYDILDILNVPHDRIYEFFPKRTPPKKRK